MRRLGLRYNERGMYELYDIISGEKVGGVVHIDGPTPIEDNLTKVNLVVTLYTKPVRADIRHEAIDAFDEWIGNYDNICESNMKTVFAEGYKAGKAAK